MAWYCFIMGVCESPDMEVSLKDGPSPRFVPSIFPAILKAMDKHQDEKKGLRPFPAQPGRVDGSPAAGDCLKNAARGLVASA